MHRLAADTVSEVRKAIGHYGSQRAASRAISIPQSVLSDIVRERHAHVSVATECRVRTALGLPVLVLHTVPACPDCGSIHTGRCHNRPVAVRPVRTLKPLARWADAPTGVLAAAIRNRQEMHP